VLDGAVGDFVIMAREERDTGSWFVGGITDEQLRTVHVDFSFLDADATYKATIYSDGDNAHWDDNPLDLKIESMMVSSDTKLELTMSAGGGFAISLLKNPDK
jgi:DeoR/GlpR family transcriptional regulator of sugar metabolism